MRKYRDGKSERVGQTGGKRRRKMKKMRDAEGQEERERERERTRGREKKDRQTEMEEVKSKKKLSIERSRPTMCHVGIYQSRSSLCIGRHPLGYIGNERVREL